MATVNSGKPVQDQTLTEILKRLGDLIMRPVGNRMLLLGWALLATACSMAQLGYSMAPTLVRWELSDFVEFDASQQRIVDERLAQLHDWHGRTQVPDYLAFLNDLQQRLTPVTSGRVTVGTATDAEPGVPALTRAEWQQYRQRVLGAFRPLFERLAEPVAEIALTLRPEQLASIERELQRRNEKVRAQYQPGTDRRSVEARIVRWQQRLEDNIGPLTEKQQAVLAARIKTLPTGSGWWESRLARQQRLMTLLRELSRSDESLETASARMLAMFESWREPLSPADAARQEAVIQANEAMMIELLALATPTQYAHARARFGGFADQLRSLLGDRPVNG